MTRRRAGCLLLAGLLALPAPARAWTDATRVRMIKDALKVTPPALNAILDHYHGDLERGMIAPSRYEGEEVHFQRADGGGLAAAAAAHKEQETLALLSKKGRLRRFAFEMGTLAHLVADVSFPLNASDADAREPLYREPYRAFIERVLDRIPFVLDPAPAPALDRGDVEAYLMEHARRTARSYERIGPAFKDDGTPRAPDALDERSVPFGIASLAYSQAVNDIARIWERLWRVGGGDMTPATATAPVAAEAVPPPGGRP